MNSPATPVVATTSQASPVATATALSKDTVTAGGIAQTYNRAASSSTTVSSLEDLKKKDPKLYHMMMQGIAMNICREMQHHQEHLKQTMRKASQNR